MHKVAVAYPSGGMVTARFAAALGGLLLAESDLYKIEHLIFRTGCYVHANRNNIVRAFLEKDADWLLQLDPDLGFQSDLVQRLLILADEKGAKCVAGWYMNNVEMTNSQKMDIPLVFTHLRESLYKPLLPTEEPLSVDAVATGCLMVHREVFENTRLKGPSPWFDFGISGHGTLIGEDMFFSKLVRDAGYEIWVDGKSKLKHYKLREV